MARCMALVTYDRISCVFFLLLHFVFLKLGFQLYDAWVWEGTLTGNNHRGFWNCIGN